MATYVKAIIYTAVAVWAIALLATGQKLSSDLLRPLSTVTSIVVLLAIAFELWLWKLPFLHGWLVKRPVLTGTWRAELRSNWKDAGGAPIPPIEAYVVIRQTAGQKTPVLDTAADLPSNTERKAKGSSERLFCLRGSIEIL